MTPAQWAAKANQSTTIPLSVWREGYTKPCTIGLYDRLFTTGIHTNWWDGHDWRHSETSSVHHLQVGSFPCWRPLATKKTTLSFLDGEVGIQDCTLGRVIAVVDKSYPTDVTAYAFGHLKGFTNKEHANLVIYIDDMVKEVHSNDCLFSNF